MAAKIDYLRFVTDPLKRREVIDLLRWLVRGRGEQAPDFELPTTDGGRSGCAICADVTSLSCSPP